MKYNDGFQRLLHFPLHSRADAIGSFHDNLRVAEAKPARVMYERAQISKWRFHQVKVRGSRKTHCEAHLKLWLVKSKTRKLRCGDKNQNTNCLWKCWLGRHGGTFLDGWNVLFLDWASGYVDLFILLNVNYDSIKSIAKANKQNRQVKIEKNITRWRK